MFKKLMLPLVMLAVCACAAPPAADAPATLAAPAAPKPIEITEASFTCIRDMKAVRGFYVSNLLGNTEATLAAANAPDGAKYPPGSVVQLVPGEAMVKHHPGFNAATNDWEFFELDTAATGTKIKVRGTTNAVNQFGGNCLACHAKAEAKWDMICEQGHGCDPIPVTPVMARAIQNTDPRCPKIDLPADQQAALQQLMAFRAAAQRNGSQ
ncbi:MAG: hypothetical protein RIR33_2258 [Pseudomonadota bacterium]|jgi:hypothetical protein